ncbi:prominin-2 isoform X1 [Phyllopteryx taeniolatus]|uniref:prominin-2 isoform X1 n=1 Tax=Phyllopteryx taeniolatus TaxID=161469 RepID=UPI002AD2B0AB|nr:prominin-2 isoform X1 [Phyllopteryx taeniolatus]XP_061647210.1 prominin-2 isoform X1 [Phyllopteryx taeniolatus]
MWQGMAAVLRAAVGLWLLGTCTAELECRPYNPTDMPQFVFYDLSDHTTGFMAATVNGFLGMIQPNPFPKDLIKTAILSEALTDDAFIKEVLSYEVGFVLCAVIGILYVLLMPLVGSVLACCRCCGNCGGEIYQKQTPTIQLHRRTLYWSTVVTTLILLAGNICMFRSNTAFKESLDHSRTQLDKTFDNINTFVTTLSPQVDHVVNQGLLIVDTVKTSIQGSGEILSNEIFGDDMNAPQMLTAALKKLTSLQKKLNVKMGDVATKLTNLKTSMGSTLDNELCNCQEVKKSLDEIQLDDQQFKDVSANRLEKSLTQVDIAAKFKDIKSDMKSVTSNLDTTQLDTIKQTISSKVKSISLNEDLLLGPVNKLRKDIRRFDPQVERAESIRGRVCIALCCLVLLVVLCNLLGLVLGPLGLKQTEDPTTRSCLANCGGIILMIGASVSFLFSWLLMLAVTLLFLVGGNVHTLVCRPWSSGELLEFAPTVLPSLDLAKILNMKSNITLSDVYRDCGDNKPLWSVLHLYEKYNIDSFLHIPKDIAFENINADIPKTSIFNTDINNSFNTLQWSQTTHSKQMVEQVQTLEATAVMFDEKANSLTDAAVPHQGAAVAAQLRGAAATLRQIQTDIENIILPTIDEIDSAKKEVTDAVEELQNVEKRLHSIDINSAIKKLVDCQLRNINQFANWAKVMLTEKFGRCGRVAEVVDSAESILCSYLVPSLNAFWFSLGWCMTFIIPSIIFSMKLAKHYRRMKYSDDDK